MLSVTMRKQTQQVEKYFEDETVTVNVHGKVLSNKAGQAKTFTLRAEETSDDWYSSLDLVVSKLVPDF